MTWTFTVTILLYFQFIIKIRLLQQEYLGKLMITTDEKYPNCPKTFFPHNFLFCIKLKFSFWTRIKKETKTKKSQVFKPVTFYLEYCFFI